MNVFALSFALMLALVLLELAVLKFSRGQAVPWKEVVFNLNSGNILVWVFRGVEVLAFGLVLGHLSFDWVGRWPVLWQWVFAFIAWDFCFYWMHRLHHKLPLLWAVHVVHHQGEHFGLSLGIRNSWYSSLTNFPFIAGLAVLGVPLEIFVAVSSFHYGVQFYNHNALVNKSGFLDRILVTPSNHRVHHGTDPAYIDRNFGGTFLVWDKIFGSYQAERDDIPMRYGVTAGAGGAPSYNPLWASNAGIFHWVRARFPGLAKRKTLTVPAPYIGIAGVLLFGGTIYYVNHATAWAEAPRVALFAGLFFGTLAIGGMSDDKHWGLAGWVLVALGMPALFALHGGLGSPWAMALLLPLGLHGLDGARRLALAAPVDPPARRSA
jgi:sterol desaturase/sphingolipid hydroxylase (fatty acid hydroxylase superfamily)